MIDKSIMLTETIGVSRDGEYTRIGIPFAEGEVLGMTGFAMLSPQEELQPVQTTILKRWHDGSVKWALLDFTASVPANGCSQYRLVKSNGKTPHQPSEIHIVPGADRWQVATGSALFTIDAVKFRPFSSIKSIDREILAADASLCSLDLGEGNKLEPVIDSIVVETVGPLRATLRINGTFSPGSGLAPQFISRLHFFAGSSRVTLEFTLRNPNPAHHAGGLWDLGDPGSLLFRELALEFALQQGIVNEIACSPQYGHQTLHYTDPFSNLSVYQESSGGDNWRSPLHRNRNGTVPFTKKGYEICSGDLLLSRGGRATPVVWCGTGTSGMAAVMPDFWQEFPKAIEANLSTLRMVLFPSCFPDRHELQGGEQKTTTMHLDFDTTADGLDWARAPLTVVAVAEVYGHSGVIPDLPPLAVQSGLASDLLDQFVAGPEILGSRREATDEYGWRNFGEFSADHEAVYHKGSEAFVSHYNNQYDLCGGIYRKFFATGDPLWGKLASNLAGHVLDIDLYHTTGDREEYNGGLFWHTDHYIPAGLSTHRSFSKEHLKLKDPRFCGGGPAAEHCYTTGLLYHYFMTGNRDYRESVIMLADWCLRSLAGSQTILASIKRAGRYITLLIQARGGARPVFPCYPLSRGTGNTMIACLDAFEVGGGNHFLEQAEELLRGAIHPDDDIAARDLLDAENAWSYTVLLTAVSKYIDKKIELEELDEGFYYARSCLLAYAEWMCRNEYPYLEKPEILEYPNETWPAQDLRKSVILYHAARYADLNKREELLKKAHFFFKAARDELARHATSGFTRPVALMLQNGWVGAKLDSCINDLPVSAAVTSAFGRATPRLGMCTVIARICGELWRATLKFSLGREIAWLNIRLQSRRTEVI